MSPNSALRTAIFESRFKKQRAVAVRARVPEARLSEIIHGRGAEPTTQEKKRLAAVLDRPVEDLFPAAEALA